MNLELGEVDIRPKKEKMMNRKGRVFGQNLCGYLAKNRISVEKFSDLTGYSVNDIQKIINGRLFVSSDDKKQIAEAVGVRVEDLLSEKNLMPDPNSGYIECRGEFSSRESLDTILDLFDAYCDIQELLSE